MAAKVVFECPCCGYDITTDEIERLIELREVERICKEPEDLNMEWLADE